MNLYIVIFFIKHFAERNGTFVDEDGNIYKNWEAYKSENKLNAGILVAPTNGHYSISENGQVNLEAWKTAAINKPNINISRQSSYNDSNSRQSVTIHEYHCNMARKSN